MSINLPSIIQARKAAAAEYQEAERNFERVVERFQGVRGEVRKASEHREKTLEALRAANSAEDEAIAHAGNAGDPDDDDVSAAEGASGVAHPSVEKTSRIGPVQLQLAHVIKRLGRCSIGQAAKEIYGPAVTEKQVQALRGPMAGLKARGIVSLRGWSRGSEWEFNNTVTLPELKPGNGTTEQALPVAEPVQH